MLLNVWSYLAISLLNIISQVALEREQRTLCVGLQIRVRLQLMSHVYYLMSDRFHTFTFIPSPIFNAEVYKKNCR